VSKIIINQDKMFFFYKVLFFTVKKKKTVLQKQLKPQYDDRFVFVVSSYSPNLPFILLYRTNS